MFEIAYRYIFFILLTIFLVACKDTNQTGTGNKDDTQIKLGSIWDSINYPFIIEIRGSTVFEYKKNPSGEQCDQQKEIKNMRILQGDAKTDNNITIEYVDDSGNTISANMTRQKPTAHNILKLDSICGNNPIWDGVWKESGGTTTLPAYYWVIKEPNTKAYYLDQANRCYNKVDILVWKGFRIALLEVTYLDLRYDDNGVTKLASIERTQLPTSVITPLCTGQ